MKTEGSCLDPKVPTDDKLATAKATVRDKFLAGLMLSGANYNCYNVLRYELANQYGFGNNLYPKTVDQCLTMLNRRKDAAPLADLATPTSNNNSSATLLPNKRMRLSCSHKVQTVGIRVNLLRILLQAKNLQKVRRDLLRLRRSNLIQKLLKCFARTVANLAICRMYVPN